MRASTRRSRVPPTRRTDRLSMARQPRLQVQRQLSDLVDEQGAAGGALERARMFGVRARERALLVAEQLALHQGGRHGRAIEDHERLGGARAGAVDRPGQHVLPGSGLADQGQRHVGGRQTYEVVQHPDHQRRARHHPSEGDRRRRVGRLDRREVGGVEARVVVEAIGSDPSRRRFELHAFTNYSSHERRRVTFARKDVRRRDRDAAGGRDVARLSHALASGPR